MFPFLLFVVAAASLIIRPDQLQALGAALARDAPLALAPILLARLAELTSQPRVGVLTFSALAAVWSSTTGVASLVTALNSAYGVSERRPQWKIYTMAFAVMLGAGLLALVAAVVAVVAPIAAKQLGSSWRPLVGWLRLPIATLLIGLLSGLISFVPYVGSMTGLVLATAVAIAQFWPEYTPVVAVVAIFLVGQFIEGYVLAPKLVGESVGLHPVWLMFALFAFGYLFGFVGLLLAVPLAAIVGVVTRFAVRSYLASPLYTGASPAAADPTTIAPAPGREPI